MAAALPTPLLMFIFQLVAIFSVLFAVFMSEWSMVAVALVLVLGAFAGSYFVPGSEEKADADEPLSAVQRTNLLHKSVATAQPQHGQPTRLAPAPPARREQPVAQRMAPHLYRKKRPYETLFLTPAQLNRVEDRKF